ncbi:MAG TPA: ATP-binding protein [Pyrinomonadaceae bacterium]|nr:ATP-binding protein [Chloracidobacterium sp.]MBP9934126.1 ATP-binding protein [Pyrinomonadaceae bacterium]MBK7801674.1 ATP-binding protein [Chloracidobacterium sp.]MBL0241985.1 ATP-binding protein [Chloracidobacterium sp.]HQX54800.1 ATP-binding protein [Pyrinomonadaceae bacterium]
MNDNPHNRILADLAAAHFVGRDDELSRIIERARSKTASGIDLLATPGAGTTELLRQAFDRLFGEQGDVIPIYFAVRTSDKGPLEAARRFAHDILKQTVAFRRSDPSIIEASPGMRELAELAAPEDAYWVDRLVEAYYADSDAADEPSYIRMLLSTPLRALAQGVRMFLMVDDLHLTQFMADGANFLGEISDIYEGSATTYAFAGARRMMFGRGKGAVMRIDDFQNGAASQMVAATAERYGVEINDETCDLIAEQLNGNPRYTARLFASAAECGEDFLSFKAVESLYCDEIFGGRIGRGIDAGLEAAVPESSMCNTARLLAETLASDGRKTTLTNWRRRLGVAGPEFRAAINRLNALEYISLRSGYIYAEPENMPLSDHIRGVARLDAGESRAQVVGEALAEFVKRAPAVMARAYRRNAAFGLRSLLAQFDCQDIPAELIDYAIFDERVKGLSDKDSDTAVAESSEMFKLPHIVYTANTAAFYPHISELIDDERSVIALGFEETNYREDTVWIAAEIESKLEAARDHTEFWLDRLEMAALSCNFLKYKIWLIAPEGFSPEAREVLSERNAFGSSRRQAEMLSDRLGNKASSADTGRGDEFELVIPMGDNTEMIAAHAVEEIAKRAGFSAKAVRQIKTALVEACINATEHSLSPDRRIYQRITADSDKLAITIANRGLRLADKVAPEIVPDQGRRGWGLKLMKGLMDEVRIEQSDDGTRITLVKYRTA